MQDRADTRVTAFRLIATALVAAAIAASPADAQCRRRSSRAKIMRPYRPEPPAPVIAPAKIIQVQPQRRIAVTAAEMDSRGSAAVATAPEAMDSAGSASATARQVSVSAESTSALVPVVGAAASMLASMSDTATILLALSRVDWSTSTAGKEVASAGKASH